MPSTTAGATAAAAASSGAASSALAKKPGLELESQSGLQNEARVEAAATPENSAAPPPARKRQRGEAAGPAPKKDQKDQTRVWQPATGAGGSSFSASVGWQRPSETSDSPIDSPSAEREPDDEYSDWHTAGE